MRMALVKHQNLCCLRKCKRVFVMLNPRTCLAHIEKNIVNVIINVVNNEKPGLGLYVAYI